MYLIGWIITLLGLAAWLVGYMTTGTPSFIDWPAVAPNWIAEFLPNLEAEIGFLLMLVGAAPMYWPAKTGANMRGREPR